MYSSHGVGIKQRIIIYIIKMGIPISKLSCLEMGRLQGTDKRLRMRSSLHSFGNITKHTLLAVSLPQNSTEGPVHVWSPLHSLRSFHSRILTRKLC